MSKPGIPLDIVEAARAVYAKLGRGSTADEAVIAQALAAERERAAKIIDDNMLVGPDGVEKIIPRGNSGNKVGLAYAAAIRQGGAS